MSDNKFGGAIWTNNALAKMEERNLPKEIAVHAFNFPDDSRKARIPDASEYIKKIDKYTISIVAKKTERGEWLVISCWCNPRWNEPVKQSDNGSYKGLSLIQRILKDLRSIVGLK